jgi:hypothetical protein
MVRAAFVALALLIAVHGSADVTTSLPPSVLQDRGVRRQIDGGLTATFLIVAQRGGDRVGASRVEIRYDLWDEVYLIRKLDFDGKVDQHRIASFEALERWWRGTPIRLLAAAPAGGVLQVELSVLPFSAAEQEDTRQWLSKSAGLSGPAAGRPATSNLVDVLIGTTIHARPILTYRWTVP